MQAATETQIRFAELQVRCARRLGELLRDEGHRGGRGSNSHRASSKRGGSSCPLPDWINWSESSRCQRLAAVEVAAFERLLEEARRRSKPITLAAVLRSAEPQRTRPVRTGAPVASDLASVWAAVGRCMQPDLAIGLPARYVHASAHVDLPATKVELAGSVAVNALGSEAQWIARLTSAKASGAMFQAAALICANPADAWFSELDRGAWSCCFLRARGSGAAQVVAYLGPRWGAFHAAMRPLGPLLLLGPLGLAMESSGLRLSDAG